MIRERLPSTVGGYPTFMRSIQVGTQFTLEPNIPTWAMLRIRPAGVRLRSERLDVRATDGRVVETMMLIDDVIAHQLVDRCLLPAGPVSVTYTAMLDVDSTPDEVSVNARAPHLSELTPADWLWLQPSRYCRPDEIGPEAWDLFGADIDVDTPATWAHVQAICDHVNGSMAFEYGTSHPFTTATDAWNARRGVCRDFNHIAVSFCRALNIPTRYVFGYLPDIDVELNHAAMDFCAWFEAFLDGRWWTFDARVNERRIGRVVIARGRDAMDVPMISTLGPVALTSFAVVAEEVPINSTQNLDLNKFDMSASGAMGLSHNPLLV